MAGKWFELESEALRHRAELLGKVVSFYIVPLDPALKGGACGALAGKRVL